MGRSPEEEILEPTEKENVVYYAGYAAVIHFDPTCEDFARASARNDDEEADSILRRLFGDDRQRTDGEQRLCAQARELVERRWPAVQAVAEGLLEWKELQDDEAWILVDIASREATHYPLELLGLLEFTGKLRREGGSVVLPGWLAALVRPESV